MLRVRVNKNGASLFAENPNDLYAFLVHQHSELFPEAREIAKKQLDDAALFIQDFITPLNNSDIDYRRTYEMLIETGKDE